MLYLQSEDAAKSENVILGVRACLKNHSRNLHAPLCGIFHPNSVAVARYGALIRAKYPTNCDAHLAESLFQTRSRTIKDVIMSERKQSFRHDYIFLYYGITIKRIEWLEG